MIDIYAGERVNIIANRFASFNNYNWHYITLNFNNEKQKCILVQPIQVPASSTPSLTIANYDFKSSQKNILNKTGKQHVYSIYLYI